MIDRFAKDAFLNAIKDNEMGPEKIERAQKIVDKLQANGVKLHTYDLRHPFSNEVMPTARPRKGLKFDRKK